MRSTLLLVLVLVSDSAIAQQSAIQRQYAAGQQQSRTFAQQSAQAHLQIGTPTVTRVEQRTWYRQPTYSSPAPLNRSTTVGTSGPQPPVQNSGGYYSHESGVAIADRILASVGAADPPPPATNTTPSKTSSEQVVDALQYFVGKGAIHDPKRAVALAMPLAKEGDADAALVIALAYLKGEGLEQNDAKALEWMSRSAAGKNSVAKMLLDQMKAVEFGVKPDEPPDFVALRKAAEAGQPDAQLRLAQALLSGLAGERNYAEALKYATKAQPSLPQAGFDIGLILLVDRPGVPRDPQRGAAALERAAKSGHAISQYLYANCLQAGLGVPRDLAAALPWLQKAAGQGLAMARLRLGEAYLFGDGIASDTTQALRWLELAAGDREPGASNLLGLIYSEGRSVARDDQRAVEYFRKDAELGDASAQLNLGAALMEGRGVPRDPTQGLHWLNQSADRDDRVAQFLLGLLQLDGVNAPLNTNEGIRRLQQAAGQRYPEAMNEVCELSFLGRFGLRAESSDLTPVMQDGMKVQQPACVYVAALRMEKGLAGAKNSDQALQLLKQAASLNYPYAELDLAKLYLMGEYLPKDVSQGRYYLERAANHGNKEALQLLQQAGLR